MAPPEIRDVGDPQGYPCLHGDAKALLGAPVFAVLIVICGLLGLVVGSFLNVVIYRVPQGMSVVSPRSACPSCGTQIAERDNVPVVSWLLLRGRCRHCHEPISARYPLVELGCAAPVRRVGRPLRLRLGPSVVPGSVRRIVGFVGDRRRDDCSSRRSIVWPLSLVVGALLLIAAAITGEWHDFLVGALSGAAWFVLFYSVARQPEAARLRRRPPGPGPGSCAGLARMALRAPRLPRGQPHRSGRRCRPDRDPPHGRQQQIPYGVFLAVGAPSPSSPDRLCSVPSRSLMSRPGSRSAGRSPSADPARPIRGPGGS